MRRLLADEGIVRNRAKVAAAIGNAQAFLAVQAEHGSFAEYLWRFVSGRPLQNRRRSARSVPAETPLSRALSDDLRRRGFRFVGPTICYAFMQAVGLVNDHTLDCFRHRPVGPPGRPLAPPSRRRRRLTVRGHRARSSRSAAAMSRPRSAITRRPVSARAAAGQPK